MNQGKYNKIQITKEDIYMLISVLYKNNTYGMVKSSRLEEYITSDSITKFFRSSGWVTISVDPIRKANHSHLRERREIATP